VLYTAHELSEYYIILVQGFAISFALYMAGPFKTASARQNIEW
jgi:hypothetical protein